MKVEARPVPTVRLMVVVAGVSVPDVPVIVIVKVPLATVEAAVNVSTLVAVAGLVAIATTTPVGWPETASVTGPVKPPSSVTVIVLVPVPPGATVTVAGKAESANPGVLGVIVNETVVVLVTVPEVAVMVIVYVPGVTEQPTASVIVTFPLVVTELGLKAAVTPAGSPLAERATLPVNPPT